MAYFSLVLWTSCQTCSGGIFVEGVVKNNTNSQKSLTIVIGNENLDNVGQTTIIVEPYEYSYFFINPTLPYDYTKKVWCVGWYNSTLQFNNYKYQYFDQEDGCRSPGAPTNVNAICQADGSCKISWSSPSDGDIYTYIIERFKNNVYQTSIDTHGTSTNITDRSITDCNANYSYQIFTIDECLRDGPYSQRVNAEPYEDPCIPNWQCEVPLNGYEFDGCGNRRLNSTCAPCTPHWQCEVPLNGYEYDGCGNRRPNPACAPCTPNWQCEVPLNGYEYDSCGNRRPNPACTPCTPNWQCEVPLNGYEYDGCGNRRPNPACTPCTPNWQCEVPLNGYEYDGCGNRRPNPACTLCTPNWQCEVPLNGYEFDGCGNRRLNTSCDPVNGVIPSEPEIKAPINSTLIFAGVGTLILVGTSWLILSKK